MALREVAERAGTIPQTIAKLEKGTMALNLEWMRLIGAALGVTPADLLCDTDNPDRLLPEERRLVEAYRRVPRRNRARILRMMLLMLSEYRNDDAA